MTPSEYRTLLTSVATNRGYEILYSPFDQINAEEIALNQYPIIIVLPFKAQTPTNAGNSELDFNYDIFATRLIFMGIPASKGGIDVNSSVKGELLDQEWTKAHLFCHDLQYFYETGDSSYEENVVSNLEYFESHENLDANAAIGVFVSFEYLAKNTIDYC